MFGNRVTLFDLFGFQVRIDASWLVLAALIVWSLAAGYFPSVAPGFSPGTYWVMGGGGLLGLALSVVVHELAHALVGRHFDLRIQAITLFMFGGVAEMTEEPSTPKGEMLMALAGPLMSLVLAAASWVALVAAHAGGAAAGNPALMVLAYLSLINLLLACFNMIPAFPLDGGRVLRAALWAWRGDVAWATRVASRSGSAFGFAFMGWGVGNAVGGNLVGGLWWVMIGLFLRTAAADAARRGAS